MHRSICITEKHNFLANKDIDLYKKNTLKKDKSTNLSYLALKIFFFFTSNVNFTFKAVI